MKFKTKMMIDLEDQSSTSFHMIPNIDSFTRQ